MPFPLPSVDSVETEAHQLPDGQWRVYATTCPVVCATRGTLTEAQSEVERLLVELRLARRAPEAGVSA